VAKKLGLLDEVKSMAGPPKTGKKTWQDVLSAREPEFYAELVQLIDLYAANDSAIVSKFPKQYLLETFISDKLAQRNLSIKGNSVGDFIRLRKRATQ